MPDADCEGLIHQVSWEKVPEQREFPAGLHLIEVSWSRSKAYMRFRLTQCPHTDCWGDDYEWLLTEMAGKVEFVEANAQTGRFLWHAKAQIYHNGGQPTTHLWRPTEKNLWVQPRPVVPALSYGSSPKVPGLHPIKIELDPAHGVSFEGDIPLPHSHWRTCFRRAEGDWRTRNEHTQQLYHVGGYVPGGIMCINWHDRGSHLFHKGPAYMTKDLNVLFIDPDEEK